MSDLPNICVFQQAKRCRRLVLAAKLTGHNHGPEACRAPQIGDCPAVTGILRTCRIGATSMAAELRHSPELGTTHSPCRLVKHYGYTLQLMAFFGWTLNLGCPFLPRHAC